MAVPSLSPKRVRNQQPEPLMWPPLSIGRRRPTGESRESPLASFDLALREGAEGIALDVHISSDGVPVIICDAPFNRTISGSGGVQEHPANTLLGLDADPSSIRRTPSRARRLTRSPIPLLSEVLRWVRDQRCMAFVAINNSTPGAEAKVLKEIDRAKVRHLIRVIANSLPELRRLRHLDAKVPLGLRYVGRPPAMHDAKALGTEVLLPHWTATSPSFIRDAHGAFMLVIPWTVNSPRLMRRTIMEGVDGIITNYPAKLTQTVERLQKAGRSVTS